MLYYKQQEHSKLELSGARLSHLAHEVELLVDPPVEVTKDEKREKEQLEQKKKEEAKNRANAVSVLVGLAARFPMLVLAASIMYGKMSFFRYSKQTTYICNIAF